MIPITLTAPNTIDLTFEINLSIIVTEDVRVFVEDNKLSPDILTVPKSSDRDYIENATKIVNTIVKDFAEPIISRIASKYDFILTGTHEGGIGKMKNNKQMLSYAHYFDIFKHIEIPQLSEYMVDQLSEFSIRLANHISKSEKRDIKRLDTVKIYNQQILDLYESNLINYTNNIFQSYTEFLNTLSNYPHTIETFEDINKTDIDKLKKFAVQGNFDMRDKLV